MYSIMYIKGGGNMTNINITNFRKDIFEYASQVVNLSLIHI